MRKLAFAKRQQSQWQPSVPQLLNIIGGQNSFASTRIQRAIGNATTPEPMTMIAVAAISQPSSPASKRLVASAEKPEREEISRC